MILSALSDWERYLPMHPRFADAFGFLTTQPLAELPVGRHEIDGEELFAVVWEGLGQGQAGAKLESHRRYIDVQYVVSGVDVIGWRPLQSCQRVKQAYDATTDLAFFFDQPETWCQVAAGGFAVFFPEDAHAPLATNRALKKVVVKLRLD